MTDNSVVQTKVSVVIATIGNISILETIKSLNNGSLQPDEIIIVVPESNKATIPCLERFGVVVKLSPFFGQVRQRNYGFSFAKNDLIVQLDDDILLDRDCLKNLINTYENFGMKCTVGPQFRYLDGSLVWPIRSIFYQTFTSIFWGSKIGIKRFGTINGVGCGHGVDFSVYKDRYKEVEWLSGGCVLQHTTSKLNELHFPFEGKAYCEDLMQSILETKKGLRHICDGNAVCWIKREPLNHKNYNLYSDFQARKHVLNLIGKGKTRLYIWYALKKLIWIFK